MSGEGLGVDAEVVNGVTRQPWSAPRRTVLTTLSAAAAVAGAEGDTNVTDS